MAPAAHEQHWLAETFATELGLEMTGRACDELETELARQLDEATQRWPDLHVPPEKFVRHLATAVDHCRSDDLLGSLAGLRVSELYLACACIHGDAKAIAEVDKSILPLVEPAIRAMGAEPWVVDEVMQDLRHTLFVSDNDRVPAIATYGGRSQLRTWIRSIAIRTASKLLAAPRGKRVGDEVLEQMPSGDDPELDFLKERYGESFRACLRAQLASLELRQRNILRQHFLDGLSIDELGVLYSVHRATAARWLAATRKSLLEGTRQRLMQQLKVDETEFDSITRLVRSQLEISLHRLL